MYLSFDSATMNSNITNIDMQQMIDCLALEVVHLIEKSEVKGLVDVNE